MTVWIQNSELKKVMKKQMKHFMKKEVTWAKRLVSFAIDQSRSWDFDLYVEFLKNKNLSKALSELAFVEKLLNLMHDWHCIYLFLF